MKITQYPTSGAMRACDPFAVAGALLVLVAALTLTPNSLRAAEDGREIYKRACAICHTAMPPKLGDKRDWDNRLKQGPEVLVNAAIKGKGTMPARGGHPKLTDAEIKAAVDYMLASVK